MLRFYLLPARTTNTCKQVKSFLQRLLRIVGGKILQANEIAVECKRTIVRGVISTHWARHKPAQDVLETMLQATSCTCKLDQLLPRRCIWVSDAESCWRPLAELLQEQPPIGLNQSVFRRPSGQIQCCEESARAFAGAAKAAGKSAFSWLRQLRSSFGRLRRAGRTFLRAHSPEESVRFFGAQSGNAKYKQLL